MDSGWPPSPPRSGSAIAVSGTTGALDSATSLHIMETLETIHKQGMTLIVVTHENDIAERAQRIIRLKDGQIVSGAP